MRREEIEKILMQNDSTVMSFPDRGEWGNNKYRGNCSGYNIAYLLWKYNIKQLFEVFAGSGTGYDVAKDMGVKYKGIDLNPNPVRDGILCKDALLDDIPDEARFADMLFLHPPYAAEIQIPYAGSMYPDPTGELSKKDLGQMPWEEFISTLNAIIMRYYAAMDTGAYMSILMGDVRRKGSFYSMLLDIVKPGEVQQVIIKQQHNYMSRDRQYAKKNFVPITHEYILVMRKLAALMVSYQLPTKHEFDMRDAKKSSWKDVVFAVMRDAKTEVSTDYIYSKIEGHKKCQSNPNWKAKVRQVLQVNPKLFNSDRRGFWYLIPSAAA